MSVDRSSPFPRTSSRGIVEAMTDKNDTSNEDPLRAVEAAAHAVLTNTSRSYVQDAALLARFVLGVIVTEGVAKREEETRLALVLHKMQSHPDYEYATTRCSRKGEERRPDGEGWEANGWEREEFYDESQWRRRLPTAASSG